jgi:uncharacterized cupin superfamily protein
MFSFSTRETMKQHAPAPIFSQANADLPGPAIELSSAEQRKRKWIRRLGKISPLLADALLDRVPTIDYDGIQVFTPNKTELRSVSELGEPWTHTLPRGKSLDNTLATGEWDSGPGRHVIKFDFDEWVHILEGEAHVTVQGQTHVLRAGDAAMFRAGLSMQWDIPSYVRKVWVHRYKQPNLIEKAILKAAKLAGLKL